MGGVRSEGEGPPPLALTYHGVSDVSMDEDPHGLFVRPADLERQIDALLGWGYRLVTFGELAGRVSAGGGRGHAALTFDDGLADNLEVLLPLLGRHDATATVFVVSGWLGSNYPTASHGRILRAEEVRELADGGVEIGSHTVTHPDLARASAASAREELTRSRRELEGITGRAVDTVAYPYGHATPDTIAACAAAGYRWGCRTSGLGSWSEPRNLPRQVMHNGCSQLGLRLKRDDRYEPLMRWRAARAARRLSRTAHAWSRRSR